MSKNFEALYYFLDNYKEFLKGKNTYCQLTLTREQATEFINEVDEVKQAMQRLEAIDNAKPDEALECVNYIVLKLGGLRCECKRTNNHRCDDLFIQENTFNTIRQALLKAQENERLLKAGDLSDGYHTFNQLYYQRCVLFASLVRLNKDKSWKSFKHSDGKYCFDSNGEWFIVGIDTPIGPYTYHYEKKYWDLFECQELERGKEWDGHTEEDVTRLLSLPKEGVCVKVTSDKKELDLINKVIGMPNNFRKLKEYDHLGEDNVSILNLETFHCIFWYDGKTYQYSGVYCGEYDFLLEYYVKGITPIFKIEHDKIVPYLYVTLTKGNK